MKKVLLVIMSIALVTAVFAQKKTPAKTTEAKTGIKTTMDSISYSIGVNIGKSIQSQKIDMNINLLFQGIKEASSNSPLALTEDQMKGSLERFNQMMMEKQKEMTKALADKNKKDGEKFLADNKKKDGVITTTSGLQYKIITKGTGKIPTAQDTVVAHYKLSLLDGKEIESTFKSNEPATFPVTGVIKGWIEALQMMPVGSKWQLFVPSDLAYGDQGAGQSIAPGSVLVFEIELISIK